MPRLFGTDGVRGEAGAELTALLAMQIGQAAAEVLTEASHHRPLFIIGKDTRISCDMLESALAAGICSVGGDVLLLGVVPTPGTAFLVGELKADAGIMISASHNPYGDNGIKIFNSDGCKLHDELEDLIEQRIKSGVTLKTGSDIGRVRRDGATIDRYITHLHSCISSDLSGLKVLVDCANGAASATAHKLFAPFKAEIEIMADNPSGVNINQECGSTHLDRLSKMVIAGGYDIGIAFDGDADRCLAVNEQGGVIDGDHIMAVVANAMNRAGALAKSTLVATVMSNLGFHKYCKANGLNVITAPVGDRYVLEEMKAGGYVLGGEQSGHVIFLDNATTGDGQLTALKFLEILAASGCKASELDSEIKQYPQILINVRVTPELRAAASDAPSVTAAIAEAYEMLGEGRILVRPSGTEPLVRVMVEGLDAERTQAACRHVVCAVEALL